MTDHLDRAAEVLARVGCQPDGEPSFLDRGYARALDAAGLLASEVWREVPGYEGRYEVSDLGNVRSWTVRGAPDSRREEPRMLSQAVGYRGRRTVSLVPLGSSAGRTHTVHGLVALAFLSLIHISEPTRRS